MYPNNIIHKRDQYYIHTYDINQILNKTIADIQSINTEIADKYLNFIDEIVDKKKYYNCCNCISIHLDKVSAEYIYSTYRSCKNIKKYLPDYLVRIYLSNDIYENFILKKNSWFNDILNMTNVELHISPNIQYFPAMIDDSVNILICRDVDNIVNFQDCLNIKAFENSHRIFYIMPYLFSHILCEPYESYSNWLTYYKFVDDYYDNYNNICDLMRGGIGIKFKLEKSYFIKCLTDVKSDIANIDLKLKNNKYIIEKRMRVAKYSKNDTDKNDFVRGIFNTGFDEILLMRFFRNLISVKYNYDGIKMVYDQEELLIVKNIILGNYYNHNSVNTSFVNNNGNTDIHINIISHDEKITQCIIKNDLSQCMTDLFYKNNIKNIYISPDIITSHICSELYFTVREKILNNINAEYNTYFDNKFFEESKNSFCTPNIVLNSTVASLYIPNVEKIYYAIKKYVHDYTYRHKYLKYHDKNRMHNFSKDFAVE